MVLQSRIEEHKNGENIKTKARKTNLFQASPGSTLLHAVSKQKILFTIRHYVLMN
jgi:hypothetical protein